jgi:hypothetical protein
LKNPQNGIMKRQRPDYKTANKKYDEITQAAAFLRDKDRLLILKTLFDNRNNGVKLWAAVYLLPVLEEESTEILLELSRESAMVSLNAKITLEEWRKGNLKPVYKQT